MQNWESRCSDCCIGILVGQINYRLCGQWPLTMRACQAGGGRYTIGPTRFVTASIIGFLGKCKVTERGAPRSESTIIVIAGGNHTTTL